MIVFIYIIAIGISSYFLALVYSIVIHELGHAFAALLFSKKEITIILGYMPDERIIAKPVRIGRVKLYFRWNVVLWKGGFVLFEQMEKRLKLALIYFAGPLMNMLSLGFFAWYWSTYSGSVLLFFLLIQNGLLLFINLYPFSFPLTFLSGRGIYNDGRSMLNLYSRSTGTLVSPYHDAIHLYNSGKHEECMKVIQKHRREIGHHPEIERIVKFLS